LANGFVVMPMLLLLLLTLACLPIRWPEPRPWLNPTAGVMLTWGNIAVAILIVTGLAQWTRATLRRSPARRREFLQKMGLWRHIYYFALFAFFVLSLYAFGWGWIVQGCPDESTPLGAPWPGSQILILAPFLFGLAGSWFCFYDVERALHDTLGYDDPPFWNRWAYIGFHLRNNLALVCVPVLLMVFVNGLPAFLSPIGDEWQFWSAAAAFVAPFSVLAIMPWVVRLILGLRPMPAGILRDRLLATSRRLRFGCTDLLVWPTRGGIVNAMVVGLFPLLRYVVVTDRLAAELTPEEIEAVFGHEVGHVKHRHMTYYLFFMMVSLAVVTQLVSRIVENNQDLKHNEHLAVLPLIFLVGSYIFLVFGFVSRRCERQADIYGCRTVSCGRSHCLGHSTDEELLPAAKGLCPTGIQIFISALEKVAYLNGISRDRPGWLQSWQHSTIARRVAFLESVLIDPKQEPLFQRHVGRVKWGLFLTMACLLVAFGTFWGWGGLLGLPTSAASSQ
jgi:STE24 endopeptidase